MLLEKKKKDELAGRETCSFYGTFVKFQNEFVFFDKYLPPSTPIVQTFSSSQPIRRI